MRQCPLGDLVWRERGGGLVAHATGATLREVGEGRSHDSAAAERVAKVVGPSVNDGAVPDVNAMVQIRDRRTNDPVLNLDAVSSRPSDALLEVSTNPAGKSSLDSAVCGRPRQRPWWGQRIRTIAPVGDFVTVWPQNDDFDDGGRAVRSLSDEPAPDNLSTSLSPAARLLGLAFEPGMMARTLQGQKAAWRLASILL
jgi:hypothetical protein